MKNINLTRERTYRLTVGLNDKDTCKQEISTKEAINIVINTIIRYVSGYTIHIGNGGYVMNSTSELVQEQSIIIDIMYAKQSKVIALADELKTSLNQESILYQEFTTPTAYI